MKWATAWNLGPKARLQNSSLILAALSARYLHMLKLGLRNLARAKLRSSLTVIGVVFGVGSVIVMLAVGEGARFEAIQEIKELGSNNIFLRSVKPVEEEGGNPEGAMLRYGLTRGDLARITATVPTVRLAAPQREHRRELRHRERMVEGRVVAVTPAYQELMNLRLESGRFISDWDGRCHSLVAVLGPRAADLLFPMEDPIGLSLRVGPDRYFEVIGVAQWQSITPGLGSDLPTQDYNQDIYIPFATDRAVFGEFLTYNRAGIPKQEGIELSQLTLAVDQVEHVKKTAEIVAAVIARSHKKRDVAITVPLDLLEKVEATQRIFTLVLGAIASISLLVGGIGIMNIMLATVTERTREIGIRRALGAKHRDVIWQFLLESMVLSGAGGLLGVLLGTALAFAVAYFSGMKTLIQVWSLVLAFSISVATGLIFGIYPARRAALMNPIEALRHE